MSQNFHCIPSEHLHIYSIPLSLNIERWEFIKVAKKERKQENTLSTKKVIKKKRKKGRNSLDEERDQEQTITVKEKRKKARPRPRKRPL